MHKSTSTPQWEVWPYCAYKGFFFPPANQIALVGSCFHPLRSAA